jgi:hypothetical protein
MARFFENKWNKNYIYHGEAVTSNKHNIITYSRMPKYYYIIYDIYDTVRQDYLWYDELHQECLRLDYEHVPLVATGNRTSGGTADLRDIIDHLIESNDHSYLGGVTEGYVVKFRQRNSQSGSYKHVIQSFKENRLDELHTIPSNDNHDYIMNLGLLFATDARFLKAKQHLEESSIEVSAESLKQELDTDFDKEYQDTIKEILWFEFQTNIKKYAREGFKCVL